MPLPIKEVWTSHFVTGTVQYKPADIDSDPAIVFLVQIDEPKAQSSVPLKGRFIEVRFTNIVHAQAMLEDFVKALNEKGVCLPDTMG